MCCKQSFVLNFAVIFVHVSNVLFISTEMEYHVELGLFAGKLHT